MKVVLVITEVVIFTCVLIRNHSLLESRLVESRLYLEGNKKSPICWFVACMLHI